MRGGLSLRRPTRWVLSALRISNHASRPRPPQREPARTSLAPRARGRRCAARDTSYASIPQGSLFLVLFAGDHRRRPVELRQRRYPPFLPAGDGDRRRRTGEATVPREGKVMRGGLSLRRSTCPANAPRRAPGAGRRARPTLRISKQAPPPRPPSRAFVRTSLALRARGRRRAARVISYASTPQGSLFLVLIAIETFLARVELRQRRGDPPFLPSPRRYRWRRTGEATVPREGKVMRDELSLRRPTRPATPPQPQPEARP
jgi:hypothetical protein